MSDPSFDSPSFLRSGRFARASILGRGAMGVVFRAHDRETDCDVALKTFAASSAEDLYRLKAEFRVLADFAHPNLVELYELFTEDQHSFFTMELVDGTNFVQALRSEPSTLLDRLPAAASQLADGVAVLHAAGRLHRDIKPSNVLVAANGRVVLLDFGLATMLGQDAPAHYSHGITGTFAYMAPEILIGSPPSPEADWYSVGVLLYESLTGELPLDPAEPRHDSTARLLPPPWRETVSLLLDASPERRRAGAARLLRERRESWTRGYDRPRLFVGRTRELAALARARDEASGSEGCVVHLVGPSGIGKSELVRRFLATPRYDGQREPIRETVLMGSCHPRESVPYKAIDPIIDRLSRLFVTDPELALACLPEDSGPLRRLFPVLDRVEAFAALPQAAASEPLELRRRGFAALGELFHKLTAHARVTLWIDDLQWSDPDSVLLLRELLRAPAPPMLVLLSYRSEDAASPLLQMMSPTEAGKAWTRIEVGPLNADDGAALVEELGKSPDEVASILADAHGNPFFLSELARSVAGRPGASGVGGLVRHRLADLDNEARRLLEIVSVSGGPLARSIALTAGDLGERGRPVATQLEKRSLLRTTTLGDVIALEMYHDRIRETLLDSLPEDIARDRHGRLADVLGVQPEPDAEALYRHNLGAGRRETAGTWARAAAERAAASLAFERAVALYGEALTLRPPAEASWPLLEKRAEALGNSGRALEAAQTYRDASNELAAIDDGRRREVLRLRERAATHFLQTGHLDEGLEVTREVLRDVGIRYPRSQGRAVMASLVQRARLGLRGFGYELRPDALSETKRLRLDACWGAAISLTMVDPAGSDTLGMRHLLESLDSGDPHEMMRALGAEAGRSAQLAGKYMRRRCARLTDMMEVLVREYGKPFDYAHLHSARGMIAFQSSLWRKAHEHFAAASVILRRDCFGVSWEKATIDTFGLSALAHSGQFRRLAELLPDAIGDASDRGDLYAALLFHTGVMNQDWLVRDEGDEALAVAEDAMARWPASDVFQVQHYVHLIATVNAELYRGDPWSAFRRVETAWPRLRAAMFLALESARVELRNMRARAAMAAAVSPIVAAGAKGPDPAWPREKLIALASKEAKKLARIEGVVSARPFARLIEAEVAAARGNEAGALRGYEDAENMLRAVDMSLHAAAAAWRRGLIRGGAEGANLARTVREWAGTEDIRSVDRMLRIHTAEKIGTP
jgi:serine/threonine protein kinase